MRIEYSTLAAKRAKGASYGKIADELTTALGYKMHKGSVARCLKNKRSLNPRPKSRFFPIWKYIKDANLPYRIANHLAKVFGNGIGIREETIKDFVLDYLYRQNLSKLAYPFISDGQAWKYLNCAAYGAITSHFLRLKEETWKKEQV